MCLYLCTQQTLFSVQYIHIIREKKKKSIAKITQGLWMGKAHKSIVW